jgi:hypothetical protein
MISCFLPLALALTLITTPAALSEETDSLFDRACQFHFMFEDFKQLAAEQANHKKGSTPEDPAQEIASTSRRGKKRFAEIQAAYKKSMRAPFKASECKDSPDRFHYSIDSQTGQLVMPLNMETF